MWKYGVTLQSVDLEKEIMVCVYNVKEGIFVYPDNKFSFGKMT